MAGYFVDSSFWIALIDKKDQFHIQAIQWSQNLASPVITTQAVLLETANTFSRPAWRLKAIALIDHIFSRSDIEVVALTDAVWTSAWNLFRQRNDKAWSLTDCISFEVMRRQLTKVLTTDAHFSAGGVRNAAP